MELELLPEWVVLCAFMVLKSIGQSALQVWIRIRYQLYATGEDKKLFYAFRKKGELDITGAEETLKRYSKLWQNDLEGIPLFLIIALGYTLLGGDAYWGGIYFIVFAIARLSYSVCYINAIQPGRGMSWDTGLVATLALTIHTLYLAVPLL